MTISKLLIVDDDIEMRQMMARYLQNSGFYGVSGRKSSGPHPLSK